MRLICPSCGALHSAEAWVNDADARQCLRQLAELPGPVAGLALSYLSLFRSQSSGRGLKWGKALRLLHELAGEIKLPHIQWDNKPARPNCSAAWAQALERIIARPPRRLPLTSHGYLKSITYEIADEMDRSAEVRRNQAERSGDAARDRNDDWQPGPEDFSRLRAAVKGIGKEI